MTIDYDRRYAYCEIYDILNWLGIDYIKKIPKKLFRMIKDERKFGYDTNIDFSKPLAKQVRQLTKNYIAYFEYNYWLDDSKEKLKLKQTLEKNEETKMIQKSNERRKEIIKKLNSDSSNISNNLDINKALQNMNEE